MGTLWNTYAFFVLYAEIDQFDATKYNLEYDKLSVMDKWLLSKLNTLIKTVDDNLANYRIPESARALQDFVDDMSNWYVRRSRERFWAKGMEQDKINAYMTLYTALVTVAKVAAPMIPFMTEDIYQNLVRSIDANAPESIHLCDYPAANEAYIDKDLEANMDEVLKLVVMGRACRNTANIKNRQLWAKGMEQDKINAYMTLYTALVTVAKVAAPMIPFMTEDIYQNLVRSIDANAPESIHLCDYPAANEAYIDKDLEANMDEVLKLVVMGRACRNTANIKNRQPIGKMFVKSNVVLPEFYQEIVEEELNVKEMEFTDDVRNFTSYTFKPQMRTVGPKYGKLLGGIKEVLANLDGNQAMDELNATEALKLDVNGQEVTLFREDLLIDTAQMEGYVSESDNGITVVLDTNLTEELLEEGFGNQAMDELNATEALKLDVNGQEVTLFREDLLIDTAQMEGYVSESDNGITVVLDTNLTEELLEEGFVRELISKIQTMRKEADFEVTDKIKLYYQGTEKAEAVFEKYETEIGGEVLATEVVKGTPGGYTKEWNINGETMTMGVEK